MNVFEAVRTVLAVREYQDKSVPRDVVQHIIESAHLTGSSMNKQPWHFVVVEDRDTLREIGALARTGAYTADAALAVVVVIERTKFAVSDASRAIQSMMLTGWSHGVGSSWVGFMSVDALKPLLHIPDELDVFAVIPFGYPVREIGQGNKQRKPLSEIAHQETFGTPFEDQRT